MKIFLILCCPILFAFGSGSRRETPSTPQYLKDYNAGVAAQQSEDYQTAIEYYQKALDQKRDFADAWNNLGYSYRMIAKSYLVKSGEAYAKAIDYDPKHEGALEYQGEYFVMMGQLKNAYRNYQLLKNMDSDQARVLKKRLDAVLKEASEVSSSK